MERTITVSGRGAIHVVPDVTRLEISIDSHFKNYQDAYWRFRSKLTPLFPF